MKKIAIVGYGKSGEGAAKLLIKQGYKDFYLFDDRKKGLKPVSEYDGSFDMTVVSPGVPLSSLKKQPAEFISEIELAYRTMSKNSKILAITGTNGKSTVTSLTSQILNNLGKNAVACGNIGYTFADAVLEEPEDTIFAVELSSFQIELLHKFEAAACAVTNLTSDHQDRYASVEEYYEAKLRIMNFIGPNGTLVSAPDTHVVNKALLHPYKVQYVDSDLEAWPRLVDGHKLDFGRYYIDIREYKLFGKHNIINLAFALALADAVAELEGDVTYLVQNLKGMPFRTERVAEINGVTWINDSKGTNIDSTLTALKSCVYPTIVLLGGRDKKGDFTLLVEELNRCASLVCAFGEAAELIENQLEGKINMPLFSSNTLKNAAIMAADAAKEGTTVILSPACASFDEFENYEDRGRRFVEYIKEIYFK